MKVTPSENKSTIVANTTGKKKMAQTFMWWNADNKKAVADQLVTTALFLKENQNFRYRQAHVYSRLYGNQSLFNFAGSTAKMDNNQNLPSDRPTFNLIGSATDTLVSRISKSRPAPVFLTDNSDYKERNLAKKLNNFTQGELYQLKAYDKAELILRDAMVVGTGCLHVFRTPDNHVGLERVLLTELQTDPNESIYGDPRQLYRFKLVDRQVLIESCPEYGATIKKAESATVDNSGVAGNTTSDLVLVVEAWHLPSGKDAKDGRHTIACSSGMIFDEEYTKDKFPFVFLHYSPRMLGFWSQGLAEQLMGTQMEINSLLYTISRAIKLVGVPRVFQEMGSKVMKTSHNNDVGVIIEYKGIKPTYEVAPCVPEELYAQLQRLINYGYQQCGVSSMQAASEKPAGLNSGEAIRSYDDIATDRFATISRRYDNVFIDLAYLVVDLAKEISEETGEYKTVFPNKNGAKQIDLPKADLLNNPYVIQCFNTSSLPRDPAGRMQKVTEMISSGMITIKEGRRLLDYPDLEQVEKLANASEERIYQILDDIIEDGKYVSPDPFMDLDLAKDITVQYYNLYASCKLEEEKKQQIRTFFDQINDLKSQAVQALAPPPPAPGTQPGVPAPAVLPPPPTAGVNSALGA